MQNQRAASTYKEAKAYMFTYTNRKLKRNLSKLTKLVEPLLKEGFQTKTEFLNLDRIITPSYIDPIKN